MNPKIDSKFFKEDEEVGEAKHLDIEISNSDEEQKDISEESESDSDSVGI